MDAYDALNQEGLGYEDAKDLLDNHIRGLELEQSGDDEIVVTTSWMRTFDPDDPAYAHLKRYMIERGYWVQAVDTSKISTDRLVADIIEWMCGDDNSSAVAVELAKEIRGDRNSGDKPTVEQLAGYVLRAIGSQESVASYIEYKLESEYGGEEL